MCLPSASDRAKGFYVSAALVEQLGVRLQEPVLRADRDDVMPRKAADSGYKCAFPLSKNMNGIEFSGHGFRRTRGRRASIARFVSSGFCAVNQLGAQKSVHHEMVKLFL